MSQNGMAAKCIVFAMGTAILLSGCQAADNKAAEGTSAQSGQEQVNPALTPSQNKEQGNENDTDSGENVSNETEQDAVAQMKSQYALAATTEETDGKAVVTNADSTMVVVNKQRYLPDGYEPSDLVEPNVKFSFAEEHEKRHLRKEAADALESLFAQAEQDGITLNAVSGYRSYKRQKSLFNHYVDTQGEEYASRVSAIPGTSEHQTGLAIDVSSPSVNNVLEEEFGDSTEGKWLAEHAHEFGFIIRYPKDGEGITGYVYEPWHIRYVGKDAAEEIYKQGTTLEQFLQ
ncbi:M15 family metallopeptidase [Paenibacillus profundus]|uniref:M15 family metallopeptidase n=1 Tax=Paenibacillus profundus TaxID=1173085 RepID=A0ABS8YAY7_9BACL|nr:MULTISPECIES: M15 family metallopeptidase [Paenibacillus]MCE5168572.1 M15 family metallopeptidase [Paenibacillus profundus]